MKKGNNKQGTVSGFTLIELLVVLAIIGILAAIAVPDMGRRAPHYRLISATGAVQSDIENAIARATKLNTMHCLIGGGTVTTYSIAIDCNRDYVCNTSDDTACASIGESRIVTQVDFNDDNADHFYPGIQFSAAISTQINFWPDGSVRASTGSPPALTTANFELRSINKESGAVMEHTSISIYSAGVVQVSGTEM